MKSVKNKKHINEKNIEDHKEEGYCFCFEHISTTLLLSISFYKEYVEIMSTTEKE